MKYEFTPETFFVKELFNPQLSENGMFCYYLLEKRGVSHKMLEKRLPCKAFFCGKKDKNATTQQWFCTADHIDNIDEEDLKATFRGCAKDRIHIGIHKGNQFSILADLTKTEEDTIRKFKANDELVCNYFGEQRFDARAKEFNELLAAGKYESALKLFLCAPSEYDSEKSTAMKKLTTEKWGKWREIADHALINATKKKELFDFLTENPTQFEEAFLHAERKSLKQMLKAGQALRFNKELCKMTLEKRPKNIFGEIDGENFPLSASKAFPRFITITATPFEDKMNCFGLVRRTFFGAAKFKAKKLREKNKGLTQFELSFELARGCYATVFLKFLDARLAQNKK